MKCKKTPGRAYNYAHGPLVAVRIHIDPALNNGYAEKPMYEDESSPEFCSTQASHTVARMKPSTEDQ